MCYVLFVINKTTTTPTVPILEFQRFLRPALPVILGNVDYQQHESFVRRVDEILITGGVEETFVRLCLECWDKQHECEGEGSRKHKARKTYQGHCFRALRCELLRTFLRADYREFSVLLAQCPLYQWFCGLDQMGAVRVPGKSLLQEYSFWAGEAVTRTVVENLLRECSREQGALELEEPLTVEEIFVDHTCMAAPIHFPVDWVLLRDAVRTLMKAVKVLRSWGLKCRMQAPVHFLKEINKLSMAMAAGGRKRDSHRERKKILRVMKKLCTTVSRHARRHRDLVEKEHGSVGKSLKQAQQVMGRIDGVLKLLPQAIKQAHERIIGGRKIDNDHKLLSLYEVETRVVVRGKAGAEVEFGQVLSLAEQRQGLIVDWMLFEDAADTDVQPVLERVVKASGQKVKAVVGDRGFSSPANRKYIEQEKLFNGICPKSPAELQKKLKSHRFVELQKRRGATEGRIGLFKNNFLGQPLKSKGLAHRKEALAWRILAHNLWVVARLPVARAVELDLAA